MTKPGDSQTKKTIHELAKEFPEKTYVELEKYRDADRQEEAHQIPLTESQKSQDKLEPIGIGHNHPPGETFKKACTLGEMKKDRSPLELMKKRAQEAEGELSILKGIETNRVKEAQAKSAQLQNELDRIGRENNDLHNKVADLTEATKSKDYFEKPDYKFLVNENHRLEQQYLEVITDNKKLAAQIEDKLNRIRKSGL